MKKKGLLWLGATMAVFGAAVGAVTYHMHKERLDEGESLYDVNVCPDMPDELVTEARKAGDYLERTVGEGRTEVTDVCEFANHRLYTVMVDDKEYFVQVDDDGTMEIGRKLSDNNCCLCSCGC